MSTECWMVTKKDWFQTFQETNQRNKSSPYLFSPFHDTIVGCRGWTGHPHFMIERVILTSWLNGFSMTWIYTRLILPLYSPRKSYSVVYILEPPCYVLVYFFKLYPLMLINGDTMRTEKPTSVILIDTLTFSKGGGNKVTCHNK